MKKYFLLFAIFTTSVFTSSYASNIASLRNITNELLYYNNLNYSVSIVIDDYKSSGFAAINYSYYSNAVTIYVDSYELSNKSNNTWAFVLGHELAHKYYGAGGTASSEWSADELGARWAINAGYNVSKYINSILNDYDSCSKSHGCWHSRAHNLARKFGVSIYGDNEWDHRGHTKAKGPYPGGTKCRSSSPRRTAVKVPCTHYVQCTHICYSGSRKVWCHCYDVLHAYDIVYR